MHLDLNLAYFIWYEFTMNLALQTATLDVFFFPFWCVLPVQKAGVLAAALAIDFESRRCDASQKKPPKKPNLEQLYLTSSSSGKSTPPSRLAINKPLPSFLLFLCLSFLFRGSAHLWQIHYFTVWHSRMPRSPSAVEIEGNVPCFRPLLDSTGNVLHQWPTQILSLKMCICMAIQ